MPAARSESLGDITVEMTVSWSSTHDLESPSQATGTDSCWVTGFNFLALLCMLGRLKVIRDLLVGQSSLSGLEASSSGGVDAENFTSFSMHLTTVGVDTDCVEVLTQD